MANIKFFLRPKKDSKGGTYWTGYARGNKVQLFEADGKTGIEYTLSMQTPRRYYPYRKNYRSSYATRPYRNGRGFTQYSGPIGPKMR